MGFLKRVFGGGGGEASFEDRIWMRTGQKVEDAVRRISADARSDGRTCLAVYHFPATGTALQDQLRQAGLACEEFREPDTTLLESLPTRVGPRDVGVLHSAGLPQVVKLGDASRSRGPAGGPPCHVHVFEHYPMLYRDTHVLNLARLLPEGTTFFGYAALDEPWIDRHLGESVRPLLERLGVDESEPLDHTMVSEALRKLQAKIGQRLRKSERHADSLEEWVRQNLDG